jgi:hypothetical protein
MLGLGNSVSGLTVPDEGSVIPTFDGLQVWYKFNEGLTASGSLITAWADSSGNGNNLTQSTETNQPSKSSPEGGIDLDGSDNFMILDTALDLTAFTIVATITIDDNTLETLFGNGSSGTDFFRLDGSAWTIRTAGSSFQGAMSTSRSDGDSYVLILISQRGASQTRYNLFDLTDGTFTTEGSVTIDNQTFTIGDVGRNSANAHFLNGKVLELAIYNTELSSANARLVADEMTIRTGI